MLKACLFETVPPFFIAMVELDGDDIRISSRGKMAERDIVQVRFGSLCLLVVYYYKGLTIIDVVQVCPT